MFITELTDPIALVSQMLKRARSSDDATRSFASLKHNKDLCPRFERQIHHVLWAYSRHSVDVQDIQGFQDKGRDVTVTFNDPTGRRQLGLQIKSQDEFAKWWGKGGTKDLMAQLTLQYAQAVNEGGAETLYLVLCTDGVLYRDAVRTIVQKFEAYRDLRIVTPTEARAFLDLSEWEIDTIVTRLLCGRDPVLVRAERELAGFSAPAQRAAVYCLCDALEHDTARDDAAILDMITEAIGLLDPDQQADVSTELMGNLFQFYDAQLVVEIGHYPAFRALYFDHKIRFEVPASLMAQRLCLLLDIGTYGGDA